LPIGKKVRGDEGKWILRQVLNKYIPRSFVDRPKTGFGVPLDSWLRGPLREWGSDLLNENRLLQDGFFNARLVSQRWQEHLTGERDWHYPLWDVLMFQAWIEAEKMR
jgi:asparagine synthase (glutamine-hydrolysing)